MVPVTTLAVRDRNTVLGPSAVLCIGDHIGNSSIIATILLTFYDTLVFLAITYKLVTAFRHADSSTPLIKSLSMGEGMGAVSRLLLQTGQLYYLCVPYAHAANHRTDFHMNLQSHRRSQHRFDCGSHVQ